MEFYSCFYARVTQRTFEDLLTYLPYVRVCCFHECSSCLRLNVSRHNYTTRKITSGISLRESGCELNVAYGIRALSIWRTREINVFGINYAELAVYI